jgi:hypothetical protein
MNGVMAGLVPNLRVARGTIDVDARDERRMTLVLSALFYFPRGAPRVPDAVQRERAPAKLRGSHLLVAREWCTGDPGPPQSRS